MSSLSLSLIAGSRKAQNPETKMKTNRSETEAK